MGREFIPADSNVGAIVGIGHKVNQEKKIAYMPRGSVLSYNAFLNWTNDENFMQPHAA